MKPVTATVWPAAKRPARIVRLGDAIDFELFAFGRICHFLRDRPPQAIIGGSLLVFRLNDNEVVSPCKHPCPP